MEKDELIVKQHLEIEHYKQQNEDNAKIKKLLSGRFFNIGQPMNDNILMFTNEQLKWCAKTVELVDNFSCAPPPKANLLNTKEVPPGD